MVNRMTSKGQLEISDTLDVTLGGQALGKAEAAITYLPKPVSANGLVFTSVVICQGVRIALTDAEANAIIAARRRPVLSTRDSILAEIAEYRRQAREAIEHAAEGERMNYAASERMADAVARLATYDAEHPQETAARQAERDAAHERFERWS